MIFNDPFELSLDFLDFSCTLEEFVIRMNKAFDSHPYIDKKHLKGFIEYYGLEKMKKTYRNTYIEQKKRALILSLSNKNDNTLMWGHYGDKHNGVCIGVRMPTIDENLTLTFNVKYVEKITPLRVFINDDNERTKTMVSWMFTKSKVWEYESEVRCFIQNMNWEYPSEKNLYYDIEVEPSLFCEIYYGVGVTNKQIEEIESIISTKKYNIEKRGKMAINPGTFDLIMREL